MRDIKPDNVDVRITRAIDPARFKKLVGLLADLLDAPDPPTNNVTRPRKGEAT